MPKVLGISAFYHDSAAALVDESGIIAASSEERFTRKKHDERFPARAIASCLTHAGVRLGDLDAVVFYEKPLLTFDRILETWLNNAPAGYRYFAASFRAWASDKLFQKQHLLRALKALDPTFQRSRLRFAKHHQSHAASAFYPSPFERAAILTLDGVGEWATCTMGTADGRYLHPLVELHHPHSLGLLYSAFTAHCGFHVNGGEYKLMGLAPYGEPTYEALILDELIDLHDDGSFQLNMRYFDYCRALSMTGQAFDDLFGGPSRVPESEIDDRHRNLAASIQAVTETIVLRMATELHKRTGMKQLCMAGGVALNGVVNGRLLREGPFDQIWVQPAAGDAGGALGAAFVGLYELTDRRVQQPDGMAGSLLGPQYSPAEICSILDRLGAHYTVMGSAEMVERCVDDLDAGGIVAWFQGRMEFGPRALGSRSILADARSPTTKQQLNATVKFREAFRPFAPAILAEHLDTWFELDAPSPYMSFVAACRRPHDIPATTHVDGSARVQSVDQQTSPLFHSLLSAFHSRTECPILINTSFNVRGEPIVQSPEDAWRCFMGTGISAMAIGPCYLRKERQTGAS
ncbi:MAG: carbamoyltransferase [Kiritimatiellia bacterium]|jgi:carbamoyltransferase